MEVSEEEIGDVSLEGVGLFCGGFFFWKGTSHRYGSTDRRDMHVCHGRR
jgi:hypothetical protein